MTAHDLPPSSSPEVHTAAPPIKADWALFLDLDGTLIDLAETPDASVVPDGLLSDLAAVREKLGGAVAIVSGRKMSDLDRFLGPAGLPRAGEHGAVLRRESRDVITGRAVPGEWRAAIQAAAVAWPGVLVEDKTCSMSIHYRQAPQFAAAIETLLRGLTEADRGFEVLPAHMAFELRDGQVHKGAAVEVFMRHTPFEGRIPVFVGDDVTDEDGMRVAIRHGGMGLRVGEAFGGRPCNVRAWLHDFVA